MSDKTQKLVLGIIDFLNASIEDGTVKEDDRESLEVAIQCIGEAFGVDPANDGQRTKLTIKPATLPSIFDVYLKTQAKMAASSQASSSAPAGPTAADKAEAEKLKTAGNASMTRKDYAGAIAAYTKAIARDPTNPVYYSNRAAAYSSDGQHVQAVADAEKAIQVDKSFVKSYHRLGHAHYALGNFAEAAAAFKRGLDLEPSNANLKTGYEAAKGRIPEADDDDDADDIPPPAAAGGARGAPDLSSLAGMFGGGGAGGGGGMPDLAGMLSNPAIAGMAQQLMANGGLDSLMSNPALAGMAQRMQSGGGMPSMDEVMSDPALRNLAQQFMGGGAGRGGGAA